MPLGGRGPQSGEDLRRQAWFPVVLVRQHAVLGDLAVMAVDRFALGGKESDHG
jgi:hypothetical protein